VLVVPDDFEAFRQDKKASSRIVECVYDPEWLTYIPSHDKSTWDVGSAEFNATDRGVGWRKGGWRFIRCRPDRGMPLERTFLAMVEKAIGEDIKLEEIERFFPDDPSKKPMSAQQKNRHDTPSASDVGTHLVFWSGLDHTVLTAYAQPRSS
jgi:hypothetical protein